MCERERSSPNSSSLLRENDLRYFRNHKEKWKKKKKKKKKKVLIMILIDFKCM